MPYQLNVHSDSLASSQGQKQALDTIASTLVTQCPDMWEMAREVARNLLLKHTGQTPEPDTIYWHRFAGAVSSTRSFTGWEHYGPPLESMTLPQLVMRRFNSHDQDNSDLLQQDGGFYRAGPHSPVFNETNEIRMLGQDVLNEFWLIDFSTLFNNRLDAFWQAHADDFRLMAKVNFLAKAYEDYQSGVLYPQHCQAIFKAVAGDLRAPITRKQLADQVQAAQGWSVRTFDIGGYLASDIVRIVSPEGHQFVYMPGETTALHSFETNNDLHIWVLQQACTDLASRARFESHFPLSVHPPRGSGVGLNSLIELLVTSYGHADHSLINQLDRPIAGDLFSYLRDQARERMYADADTALRSNSELRKQMWIGYLNAFTNTFGVIGAVCWPVALAVVGADLASLGLNIDQAVNGDTTAERKAGVTGAIVSAVSAALDATLVFGVGAAAEVAEVVDPLEAERSASGIRTPRPPFASEARPLPEIIDLPLERPIANVIVDGQRPQLEGNLRGTYLLDGQTYITLNGDPYAVRYVGEMKTWVIIDEQNPYAFYRSQPVRLNAKGQWELLPKPGLQGGGKFWSKHPWGSSAAAQTPVVLPLSPYEVPVELRAKLESPANNPGDQLLKGYIVMNDPELNAAAESFTRIRTQLAEESRSYFRTVQVQPRVEIPTLAASATPKSIFQEVFQRAEGLVIGERHSSIASKKFLIENMEVLAKQKVRTLYMEHLLTDFHQADLDIFMRTGKMPPGLNKYLKSLDSGFGTDPSGQFTFLNLVKAAQRNHLRIQAIDCMASYRQTGLVDLEGTLRVEMMNRYATSIISAVEQQSPGRWIALVGESHANTFEQVPGLSELNQAIGLRVADAEAGTTVGLFVDEGRFGELSKSEPPRFVKNDLVLRMVTTGSWPADVVATHEARLPRTGMFLIEQQGDQALLFHRSNDRSIVRTAIRVTEDHVSIDRPSWPRVHKRRFNDLRELAEALKLMGLTEA
ncbi:membrane-targeted effector domain-containing toxin [Pseudomonas sp. B21-012]|uniref:membrane-targeted effector domain-containing toxin n=1 Tax=Pseudomonas sp. B21-012 TaxID=2895472 RepID=UPI00215EA96F|nr:membrane-targeted effector domain-containing toxin [Pseudomonas sp. B21-012]UVM57006.1 membrane-targeted effector domain-containing toxin [Pseudomonas sp. B21-012]